VLLEARKRVRLKTGIRIHLRAFALGATAMTAVNLLTTPAQQWFWFPVLGWLLGVFAHAGVVHHLLDDGTRRALDDELAEVRRRAASAALSIAMALGLAAADVQPAGAQGAPQTLTVTVRGVVGTDGEIGCALFTTADGFPKDTKGARQLWIVPAGARVQCVFTDVVPGTYAVSVVHDRNGNRRVDTGRFGIPTEPWGVSRNVVHTLRAPRMQEAQFDVGASPVLVDITLVR
jgi:uncharacterized protein (DUF2141 family)